MMSLIMRANPRGSRGNVCERPEDMAWHVHETGRPRFTCHVKRSTRQIPIFTTCARNLYYKKSHFLAHAHVTREIL